VSGGERRLTAFMFTDIVGYTRSTQANESLTLKLFEEHRGLLRPRVHSWPFLIKSLPIFEELRRDPRFPEFRR
jgi:hypothetical protein